MFSDLVRRLIPQCPNVRYLICLDRFKQENEPQLEKVLDYETLIGNEEALWEDFSESTASGLCYTSVLLETLRVCSTAIEALCCIRLLFVYLIAQVFPRWIGAYGRPDVSC